MTARTATKTDELNLVWPIAIGLVLLLSAWTVPASVTWMHDGSTPPLGPSVVGTIKLIGHHVFQDPATAYPSMVRRHMPAGAIWWWPAGLAIATIGAIAAAIWHSVDTRVSQAVLGRRPHELRGSRPRAWARPRDLGDTAVQRRQPDRFTLGLLDGRLLASDSEAHVAVIAPTRSGKTTRCVIPWLLEHDGPAIVTSTKTDVLAATRSWRERNGRVTIFDPFGSESAAWSPLAGCTDWSMALRQAQWLADSVQEGASELASYWRGEAARLLAPLLHAAALGNRTIAQVTSWTDGQTADQPIALLRNAGAEAALTQLSGVMALDPRNRGTIYMSAGSLLAAYRYPEVAHSGADGLTPEQFLDGAPNTLYVVASSRQQRLLTPLVVAMISSILNLVAERANANGSLSPTLRVLLDEAANIAPIRDLAVHLSQAAGHGVRIATIWQSLAQIHERYPRGADDILANSTAKLYLGPVTDHTTSAHIRDILGEEQIGTNRTTPDGSQRPGTSRTPTWRPKASAAGLQQLKADRALLIEGRHPPAVIRLRPWWAWPGLKRRATAASAPSRPTSTRPSAPVTPPGTAV